MEVSDQNILGIFSTQEHMPERDTSQLVTKALRSPIGTQSLSCLARGKEKVLIVCDDISRPTPTEKIVPPIITELHAAGIDDPNIEFMFALGTHRLMTREEMVKKLGKSIVLNYEVYNHDWKDRSSLEYMGKTAQGVEVWINRKVAEADLVIGVGRIMPIEVCGFTGGGKILIPGVCGRITNDDMHWTRIDIPDEDIIGKRDNPVRESIDELARKAGLDFIVNVVMDIQGRVSYVVAGDIIEAHRKGSGHAKELHTVLIPELADIVIADSKPFDSEFWQANKALDQ
ncbi:MAG: nickel-dependent lactate racemase, partial [Thermoplasmata archaeon]|nr:nickel-dependent lactate racemase [Thermoplasmata archaeon]